MIQYITHYHEKIIYYCNFIRIISLLSFLILPVPGKVYRVTLQLCRQQHHHSDVTLKPCTRKDVFLEEENNVRQSQKNKPMVAKTLRLPYIRISPCFRVHKTPFTSPAKAVPSVGSPPRNTALWSSPYPAKVIFRVSTRESP